MKTQFSVIILIIFIFTSISYSIDFKYNQKLGRKLRFKNQVVLNVYHNKQYLESGDQMNKVILELTSISNGMGTYEGKYYNYNKKGKEESSYKLMNVYSGSYQQNDLGKMIVSPSDIIPSTRSVLTFPGKDIKPGDRWTAPGEEILDNIFDNKKTYKTGVEAQYQYLSNLTVQGVDLALFSVEYPIIYQPYNDPALLKITGSTKNIFYWDISNSAPYFYHEDINMLYTARNGETYLYQGEAASQVEEVTDITNEEKTNLIQELSNQISSPTNGMNVRETNDGIIVNLGNILFDVDKYTVKKDYEEKLDNLASILNQYPKLDIVVSGHTDNTGSNPYNTKLSENRAKSITEYLISKGISPNRISYIGYGSDIPIADNKTEAGKALNRRVEVKIITQE